ncbi:Bro-N domain-containing protein [Kaistia terrae]|uniref:Bro-N domain-containing protein n=1 Tax=Kaistia terrae TaxID=537017 RepID=A0ABW0PZA2_9HYPH
MVPAAASPSAAVFLTRKGVKLLLMASTKPQAEEFRAWLAGGVVPTIADPSGYPLNGAARETAHADMRTALRMPEAIGDHLWTLE